MSTWLRRCAVVWTLRARMHARLARAQAARWIAARILRPDEREPDVPPLWLGLFLLAVLAVLAALLGALLGALLRGLAWLIA